MAKRAGKACPQCGEKSLARANFCHHCGKPLEPGALAPQPGAQTPLDQWRADFLAHGIHTASTQMQAMEAMLANARDEYRQAASMFIDVSGFAALTAQRPLEEVKSLLDEFYQAAAESVIRHNGFIVKLLGDGVLAVFGAPVSFDRDAESAIHSALEIVRWAERHRTFQSLEIRVRAGVATGEIMSGLVRRGAQSQFDIFGHAVNLSERLQKAARLGEVVVDETTRELAEPCFHFDELEPMALRHIEGPVRAFRATARKGPNDARRAFASPFVGRGGELRILQAEWERVRTSGESAMVFIEGEGGMGKTRLAHEFAQRFADSEAVCFTENAPSPLKESYSSLGALLHQLAGVRSADSRSQRARKIRMLFRETRALSADEERFALGLLNALERDALGGMPNERLRAMGAAALAKALSALAEAAPRIWLLDDLHWADDSTVEFLARFAGGGIRGWLLVMTARIGYRGRLRLPAACRRLRLGDLTREQQSALLAGLIDLRHCAPALRETIRNRSGGNPLFMEELAGALRQRSESAPVGSEEALGAQAEAILPSSLRALLQSRIDMLERQSRLVLQCGAVIGRRFALSLLDLIDLIRDGLRKRLRELEAWEFLRSEEDMRGLHYLFKHALSHEVAYRSLPARERRQLHRLIAQRIEESPVSERGEQIEALAYHYEMAGEPAKAFAFARQIMRRAAAAGTLREALNAIVHCETLAAQARGAVGDGEALELALQRARIERFLGDLDANRHTMEHAEALLKRLDRPSSSQAAWLAMETGLRAQHLGQYEKALVRFRQARDEWRAAGQPRGEAQALNAQCMCLIYLGDYDGTIRAAREGLRLAGADARWRTEQANLLNNLALALWRKGSLAEAHEAIQSAAVCQRKAGDSLGLAATIMNRGILEEERRHDKRAESSYLNAIRLAERYGFRQVVCCAEANLGNLALKRGRFDLALRHSQKSLEIAEAIQDARSQAIALENIGLACAGLREYADAAKAYERAGAIARRSGDTERAASVGLCRAELDLARGRIALAEKRLAALSQTSQQPPTPDCAIRLKQLEAQTLATRRRTAEAIEAARQSVRLAESAGLADHARRGAELLSSLL